MDNVAIQSIYVQLFTTKGLVIKDKTTVGELFINWQECLQWPGLYLTQKSFLFKGHQQQPKPSKIYVQVRWVPRSLYQELTGFSAVMSDKDKKNMLKQEVLTNI